jgi:hypothetical protein
MSGALATLVVLVVLAGSVRNTQAAGSGLRGGITRTHFIEHLGQRLDEPRDGYTFGMYSIRPMSSALGMETGLAWTTKGGTANRHTTTFEPRSELEISYIEFPTLLRFDTPGRTRIRLHAVGGTTTSLKVTSKFSNDPGGDPSPGEPDVRRLDFGVTFGGGVDLLIGSHLISFDLRETWGLRNVLSSTLDGANHSRALLVSLGK